MIFENLTGVIFGRKSQPEKLNELGSILPGEMDWTTGKEIIYIAFQTERFYVSIDSDINLNWFASDKLKFATDFGEVVSQVSLTEALVDRIFVGKKNRIAYKKMLGDVLSRLLDEADSKTARSILDEAKLRIIGHSNERVRMAYIYYAVASVLLAGTIAFILVYNRTTVINAFASTDIFRVVLCSLLGGIGAFITTFSRFKDYQGSIIAGLAIHRLDGTLRIFYGLIAGLIIGLAIKGKVLAGFADIPSPWIMYFFAMIAGASEMLVPNLIRQAETQTTLVRAEPPVKDPVIPSPPPLVPNVKPVVPPVGQEKEKEKTIVEELKDNGIKLN